MRPRLPSASRVLVAKNDPITFASEGGAAHLVEVNANDIACMGATPRWLLVTALLPHGVTPADVLNQFAELRETCRQRSVELIGGHTEIVPGLARPILVGMMLGDAASHELVRPGEARPGDVLLVTKGLAIEGTALLARERADVLQERIGGELVRAAASLLDEPGISIVAEAEIARRTGEVTALHDPTEGGFASAVRELAIVSGAGVEIDGRGNTDSGRNTRCSGSTRYRSPGHARVRIASDRNPGGGCRKDRARHGICRNPGQRRWQADRGSRGSVAHCRRREAAAARVRGRRGRPGALRERELPILVSCSEFMSLLLVGASMRM